METPIEVLRIEQNVVSKELGRFRACDPISRSFYCREWAQYIYKKHFVWNAKTQEDMTFQASSDMGVMSTGHYTICMLQPPCEAKRKERSPKLSEQFEKLLEAKATTDDDDDDDEDDDNDDTHKKELNNNTPTLTQDIIQACVLWQSLPSSLSGLPSIFEPVQFNPFPDHIPLDDDLKAPAQLLDPLIIERQALCLPSEGFHLLKNLTGDILLSHTQPTCLHTKPDDPSPTDLELDRQMLNDDLQTITTQVLAAMDRRLQVSWQPLLDFLRQLGHLEEQRNRLMGQQCQATVDAFVEQQHLGTFATLWQQHNTNSTHTVEMVNGYLDGLIQHVQQFLNDFVNPRLVQIGQLIQDLWDLVGPTIQHMAERMATHEERDKGNAENCKAVSQSLKGLHSTKEVDEAIDRIQHAMADRVDEYVNNVHELKRTFMDANGLKSKMDKIQHKEFRKRIKRLESGYTSLRQFFRYEVTQKIFPETLFCKFSLVCLGALMQEGEVMEAMIIETEVKRFIESHRPLVKRRQSIVLQYEEGVQVGRRELAGILGKLYLKEGMRIQGENLALKRQAMLLKSMGVADGDGGDESSGNIGNGGKSDTGGLSKKKKKNKKKKAATAMAATPVNTTTDVDNDDDEAPPPAATDVEDTPSSTNVSTSSSATTVTAASIQPPPSSSDKPASSPQAPIKKNKVLTIPPSPASIYVPPPPLAATTTKTNTSSAKKAKQASSKASSNTTSTTTTTSTNISTPKKNGNIPGAPPVNGKMDKQLDQKSSSLSPSDAATKNPPSSSSPVAAAKAPHPPSSPSIATHEKSAKEETKAVTKEPVAKTPKTTATSPPPPSKQPSINEPSDKKEDMEKEMAVLVQQWQQEKEEMDMKMKTLQQDMTTMQQQYMDKLKEQQQQTWQWYEQQQVERKEMQRYIQQLEQQVKQYQQHSSNSSSSSSPPINPLLMGMTSVNQKSISPSLGSATVTTPPHGLTCAAAAAAGDSSSSSHWLTAGFGNQDLFAGYRQEMQSSSSSLSSLSYQPQQQQQLPYYASYSSHPLQSQYPPPPF